MIPSVLGQIFAWCQTVLFELSKKQEHMLILRKLQSVKDSLK